MGVFLSSSFEGNSAANPSGATVSYATKRFFGRESENFFKRPLIEARWNDSNKDDRSNFYMSSALAPASDNINTLYLYNFVRGRLANIPAVGTGSIFVNLHETLGSTRLTQAIRTPATGGFVSTGIYSCSVCISGTYTTLRDVWFSGNTEYFTGSVTPKTFGASTGIVSDQKIVTLPNLRHNYDPSEKALVRVNISNKLKNPTIYTVATSNNNNIIVEDVVYKIVRNYDNLDVIPYGTGSTRFTELSYDSTGSYFTLDCDNLETDYEYRLHFAMYDSVNNTWDEHPSSFKFKISSEHT